MRNYVINGRVEREKIAADIRDRVLDKSEIAELVSQPEIREAFIGDEYHKKVSMDGWSKAYLSRLPNAAAAEAFNEDYLYYLADVAEYVSNFSGRSSGTSGKRHLPWILIGLGVAIALCVIVIVVSTKK